MKWGPEADAKLFAAVMKVHQIKLDYQALATEMNSMGEECTAKAITHRISKIKSDATSGGTNNATDKPPKTPPAKRNGASRGGKGGSNSATKSSAKTPASQKKTWSDAKKRKVQETESDSELEGTVGTRDESPTPTKSATQERAKHGVTIKSEFDESERSSQLLFNTCGDTLPSTQEDVDKQLQNEMF